MIVRTLCRAQRLSTVSLTWNYAKTGEKVATTAEIGDNLLQVAHKNGIDLEGACEGSLACSTCHVILPNQIFDALEPACDEEEDMLDLAYGLSLTSRLGCQVIVDEAFDGVEIQIPAATRNFAVDGFVPKPH